MKMLFNLIRIFIVLGFIVIPSLANAECVNLNSISYYNSSTLENFSVDTHMKEIPKAKPSTNNTTSEKLKSRVNIGNGIKENSTTTISNKESISWDLYMKKLQREIKNNWEPPVGIGNKRIILLFKISRNGKLLNVKVVQSSNSVEADNAAIAAVKLSEFDPLPTECKEDSIDIQFTFDNNSSGRENYYYGDYNAYLEKIIRENCNISELDSLENFLYFDFEFDDKYNLLNVKSSVNKYNRDIQKLYLYNFKKGPDCRENNYRVFIKNINRQKRIAQKDIIGILRSYWMPSDSYSSCIVKVNLYFYKGGYAFGKYDIDSYDIVQSSGNSEYNDMVKVAFVRLQNLIKKQKDVFLCTHFYPVYGEMSVYFSFQGDKLVPYDGYKKE